MSNIIVAFILVVSVMSICLVLVSIHNKQKRKAMTELLNYFREAASENNISFSSEEVLHNSVLGLDGVQRKMLFVTRAGSFFNSLLIDVNEIKSCTVKKIFRNIQAGDLKDHQLEQYLNKIILHLEMAGQPAVEFVFYNHTDNHMSEIHELEQKAGQWENFLTKMQKPLKNTG